MISRVNLDLPDRNIMHYSNKYYKYKFQHSFQIEFYLNDNSNYLDLIIMKRVLSNSEIGNFEDDPKFNAIWQTVEKMKSGKNILTYYLPCYMRIKIKNIKSMQLAQLRAEVNATLLLNIYYGPLPIGIVKQIQKKLLLNFDRNQALSFDGSQNKEVKMKIQKNHKQIKFTIRKFFNMRIDGEVRYSPFQVIYMILSLKIQSIIVNWKNNVLSENLDSVQNLQEVQIKFNLMDIGQQGINNKISYNDGIVFGYYDLAEKLRNAQFTDCQYPSRIMKKQNIQIDAQLRATNHFQYAHFIIPMYKYPGVTILTIFVPIEFLAVVNFAIFFQQFGLADRIACIATLMIAYLALIPIIKSQLAKTPIITLMQLLVYFQVSATLLCLIESIVGRNRDQENDVFQWDKSPLFLAALVITIFCTLVVLIAYLFHRFYLQHYVYNQEKNKQKQKQDKFESKKWNHHEVTNKDPNDNQKPPLWNWIDKQKKRIDKNKISFISCGTTEFPPAKRINVATLNFSAILNSPFEFYSIGPHYMLEMQLSRRFKINLTSQEILKQLYENISEDQIKQKKAKIIAQNFKWQIGQIDKHHQMDRYSPLYDQKAGVWKGKLLTKQQFYDKWMAKWKQQEIQIDKIDKQLLKRAKIFDFVCYQSLVQVFCSSITKDFNKIIKDQSKSVQLYENKMKDFFEKKEFLKLDKKYEMLIENGIKDQMIDVIFLQEVEKNIEKQFDLDDYKIVKEQHGCAIIIRRQAFQKKTIETDPKKILSILQEKGITQDDLKWKIQQKKPILKAAVALVNDMLLISAHLSSSEKKDEQNKSETDRLQHCLGKLQKNKIKFIIGITANNVLKEANSYQLYPTKVNENYTKKKTRTALQAQYNKIDKPDVSCSDFIISSQKMDNQKICTISSDSYKKIPYLPSNEHPFDHFMVFCSLQNNTQ